jgi:hypothetical protein
MGVVTAAPPNVVHWTPRSSDHNDCVLLALCQATGFSYEETLAAALTVQPAALETGLTAGETRRIVKEMGFRARVRRRFDLDDDTGVLFVRSGRDYHAVYLWAGRVINTTRYDRGALWLDPEEYLKNGGWAPDVLVTVES